MFGIEFYPTPATLAMKMIEKIDFSQINFVLDGQAGRGDLLDAVLFRSSRAYMDFYNPSTREFDHEAFARWYNKEDYAAALETTRRYSSRLRLAAIEIDPDLQAVVAAKGYELLGTDFLKHDGLDQPDCIVMNPPFSNGDAFLLAAINMMFSGQIVCILNAQTIRNPSTLNQKALVKKLNELKADVQYFEDEFAEADRKTRVEVAMIHIKVKGNIKTDILDQLHPDTREVPQFEQEQDNALVFSDRIKAIVQRYNATREAGIQGIFAYYSMPAAARQFISLSIGTGSEVPDVKGDDRLTKVVQNATNLFLKSLRRETWKNMLDDPALTKYLSHKAKQAYRQRIETYSTMDVSEQNIRILVAGISAEYPKVLSETVLELFDSLTTRHAYYPETANNCHYFDGWASNKAHYVNTRVVMPHFSFYDSIWQRFSHQVSYGLGGRLDDLDRVMSYFDGGRTEYLSLQDAVNQALAAGQTKKIRSHYFEVNLYQKGTMHVRFLDADVLRRFNIFCGSKKNWLPPSYGQRSYNDMCEAEKAVVEAFEGRSAYKEDSQVDPFARIVNVMTGPLAQQLEYTPENSAMDQKDSHDDICADQSTQDMTEKVDQRSEQAELLF